jgi:hypothetical protein
VALAIFEGGGNFASFGTGQGEAYPQITEESASSTEVGTVLDHIWVWTRKNLKSKEGDAKGEKKRKCGGMRLQLAGRHYGGWTLQLRRVILTRPRAEGMWGARKRQKGSSEREKKERTYWEMRYATGRPPFWQIALQLQY